MKSTIIVAAAFAAALAGCTIKSTTVERPPPAPVVYAQPAPTVVYQAPPTVVYQAQAPAPIVTPPPGAVTVNYNGPNGYRLAWGKANSYCAGRTGNSRVELISNDETAGRAVFLCHRV